MKQLSVAKYKTPPTTVYEVYDNYIEAHIRLVDDYGAFLLVYDPSERWKEIQIEGVTYYSATESKYKILLTKDAYDKMVNETEKFYGLNERDLPRYTRKSHVGSFATPDKKTKAEVIAYMRDKHSSWLPGVYSIIDEEMNSLQLKMSALHKEKQDLQDDEYLSSKIREKIKVVFYASR